MNPAVQRANPGFANEPEGAGCRSLGPFSIEIEKLTARGSARVSATPDLLGQRQGGLPNDPEKRLDGCSAYALLFLF
jgi:hypothetical protein